MSTKTVKSILDIHAHLGECPTWSSTEQVLYFTDILSQAIHRFDPKTEEHSIIPTHEHVGCFGLREKGGFIAAMRSGIFLLDSEGKVTQKIAENPTDTEDSRFNDGRVDPWGRFWCGTVWETDNAPHAKLCCVDTNLNFSIVVEGLTTSNGLAFSPDKKWMFYSDTPNHVIYRQPLNPDNGTIIGGPEIFHRFDRNNYQGQPDGAAFDSEGNYWSAQFGDGLIVKLSPQSEILEQIELPVKWPTMVAFGGDELKTLFITSSREDLTAKQLNNNPQSGNLFATKINVVGNKEPLFKG
ncbi:SMP-30/gluconolactonase/LRE family protein [Entomomonas asaccharolytica]|uniref:SMP-30/gluconolactonase/LRE family protein n=1 Tax=Entomomonas asaccharolytica TaxID=2785331 RepID=A0A974NGM1_9GAMM|nr:SMP-30/gluconolactonase/LRE family protein [Entomomonas asaccharolytica]QQP86183.1 SMP-30/gluconolactonase/LRE family protein [Entomomonas asaccharolytica]